MKWLLTTKDGKARWQTWQRRWRKLQGWASLCWRDFWDQETLSSWPLSLIVQHRCSQNTVIWFYFKVLFFFFFHLNIQKAKQNKQLFYTLTFFVHQHTTYKNAKISPLPPKVNIVHLMSILLNFWMDGC